MATVTKSIGTASRDYSTIAAWEADLDNAGIYASGDKAVGECYNDSTFSLNSEITINGGATRGLSEVVLSVASGQRHAGTAGTGARIVRTGNGRTINQDGGVKTTIEWLELDYAGYAGLDQSACIFSKRSFAGVCVVKNILIHDMHHSGSFGRMGQIKSSWTKFYVQNCIVYDCSVTDNNTCQAIQSDSDSNGEVGIFHNNTVYKVTNGGTVAAITVGGNSEARVRNCIAVGNTKDFSGAGSSGTYSNNLSSDTTAPGTSSLTSKTATNQFVSIVNGSEDLHLKSTADAKDAGVDLATNPTDVQYDIDGRNRDSEGDTWDIGADEYVSSTGTLSGASNLSFTDTGELLGSGALSGPSSLALTFTTTGDLVGVGSILGSSILTFTDSGDITGVGALNASTTVDFSTSGLINGNAACVANTTLDFSTSGLLGGTGTLLGNSSISFSLTGDLALGLVGSTSLAFTLTGNVVGIGAISGTSSLTFGISGGFAVDETGVLMDASPNIFWFGTIV